MKKYIYIAIALVMSVFVSCTDKDDIEINISHDIEFSIKTKGMYDTFDVANTLQDRFFRDKTYAVGTQSFIYDSNGELIYSNSAYDFSFNNQTFQTNLNEGSYTVVTIESIVDPDKDYNPTGWIYSGTNSLKELKIIPKYNNHSIYDAIGVYTAEISVTRDDRIFIEPKAIGSYVQIHYHNWDKSKMANVGFGTYNNIIEYKLDPSLDRDSKYIYENTESSNFNLLGSLSVEESVEGYINVLYILDNEISYVFKFQDQEHAGTSTWSHYRETGVAKIEDGKTYYGGYAFNGDLYYPSYYFGDYNGYQNWVNNLKEPESENITFKSPSTQWGASVSTVKSYMSGYTLSSDIKQYEDGTYGMIYEGKNSEDAYAYFFQNRTGNLLECDVYFDKSTVSIADLSNIITEQNYQYVTETDNQILYVSQDYSTLAMIVTSGSYNLILYVSYDYFMSLSSPSRQKLMSKDVRLTKPLASQRQLISVSERGVSKSIEKTYIKMPIK